MQLSICINLLHAQVNLKRSILLDWVVRFKMMRSQIKMTQIFVDHFEIPVIGSNSRFKTLIRNLNCEKKLTWPNFSSCYNLCGACQLSFFFCLVLKSHLQTKEQKLWPDFLQGLMKVRSRCWKSTPLWSFQQIAEVPFIWKIVSSTWWYCFIGST